MSNILAITQKELKSYFSSPIAYVVIGLYALVYGYYFYAAVRFFERQSMQMMGLGAGNPRSTSTSSSFAPSSSTRWSSS
jgi:ABC-2 type transport system permease protein